MDDLISRQAAIDTSGLDEEIRCEMCKNPMHTNRGRDGNCKYDEKLYERIIQILDKRITPLPSAQPERKKEKWYKPTGMMPPEYAGVYRCSKCDEIAMRDWKHHKQVLSNFCPNCGADMRGEQDE